MIGKQVRDSVWRSVESSVWYSVGNSVGNSVRDSVWHSVRDLINPVNLIVKSSIRRGFKKNQL